MRYPPLPSAAVPVAVLATIVVILSIGWGSFRNPAAFWAPGDLSRSHANVAACLGCHEPFHGPSPPRCAACHSELQADQRPALTWHRDFIERRTACTACHAEHRGAGAALTDRKQVHPHGEFVFRATATTSCRTCHAFGARVVDKPTLLDDPAVKRLLAQGQGAHVRGRMADCLACHGRAYE
jgi:hypothetical protein